jgi:Flp/Fap pilin component
MQLLARFARDESGATAIEYGLIAALIAVGIIAPPPRSVAAFPTCSAASAASSTPPPEEMAAV